MEGRVCGRPSRTLWARTSPGGREGPALCTNAKDERPGSGQSRGSKWVHAERQLLRPQRSPRWVCRSGSSPGSGAVPGFQGEGLSSWHWWSPPGREGTP